MRLNCNSRLKLLAVTIAISLGLCHPGAAQQLRLAGLLPGTEESGIARAVVSAAMPAPMMKSFEATGAREAAPQHRFWDRQNSLLFATSAVFSAADFVVTRDNLRGGGQELNPVTRIFSGSTAGLAVNFAGEAAGVVGLSYVFHQTGHHKLERLVSLVNIGSSAAAVGYDVAHR